MEHAAFARGHRGKCPGLTGCADFLDGGLGGELEVVVANGFEALGVEVDAVVIFRFEAEDFGGDVFDGVEEFAVVSQEERGVRTGELNLEVGSCRERLV